MKKQLLAIIFISAVFYGCDGDNVKQDGNDTSVKKKEAELIQETKSIDSVTMEMDKAKNDIQKSSDKLDELLNDL